MAKQARKTYSDTVKKQAVGRAQKEGWTLKEALKNLGISKTSWYRWQAKFAQTPPAPKKSPVRKPAQIPPAPAKKPAKEKSTSPPSQVVALRRVLEGKETLKAVATALKLRLSVLQGWVQEEKRLQEEIKALRALAPDPKSKKKVYSAAFKVGAVRVFRESKRAKRSVAKELGVDTKSLRTWREQDRTPKSQPKKVKDKKSAAKQVVSKRSTPQQKKAKKVNTAKTRPQKQMILLKDVLSQTTSKKALRLPTLFLEGQVGRALSPEHFRLWPNAEESLHFYLIRIDEVEGSLTLVSSAEEVPRYRVPVKGSAQVIEMRGSLLRVTPPAPNL